ncbi:MAG: helix-turn-helix transcriptional regulator, partial [Alphaproteobacteria bacterium]
MAAFGWDTLTDRIYEAAAVPELWRGVLADVTTLTDAAFGCLFAFGGNDIRWIGTPESDALIQAYVSLPSPMPNPRLVRGFDHRIAGFQQDLDIFRPEEMAADPFYRDFLRPRGYGWCVGTFIELPDGDRMVVNMERRRDDGPFTDETVRRLDLFRPHIARAAMLSARLGLERARATADALNAVGLPAAVLRAGGRIAAANAGLEALMPAAIVERRHRIALADPRADALLATALESIGPLHEGAAGLVRSLPIAGGEAHPPLILHLVPVRGVAQDIFVRTAAILVVTPVEPREIPPIERVLQVLFDLSPAESRVARGIGSALTVEEIATAGRVSRETVRNQLKAVLQKTGTSRQAELVN